jgi:hypothetical protein
MRARFRANPLGDSTRVGSQVVEKGCCDTDTILPYYFYHSLTFAGKVEGRPIRGIYHGRLQVADKGILRKSKLKILELVPMDSSDKHTSLSALGNSLIVLGLSICTTLYVLLSLQVCPIS